MKKDYLEFTLEILQIEEDIVRTSPGDDTYEDDDGLIWN